MQAATKSCPGRASRKILPRYCVPRRLEMELSRTFFAKPSRLSFGFIALLLVMAALPGIIGAQESSSRPADGSTSPDNLPSMPAVKTPDGTTAPVVAANSPAAALRDVLQAACAQNSAEFSRYLTVRSKASFERLTPAARVALMKRFVLLNEPGKATASANPAGRPIVRCETPDVTTEMQVGGAELRDNVAFLPMELRNTSDIDGAKARQATKAV